jgi:hypothetical protein
VASGKHNSLVRLFKKEQRYLELLARFDGVHQIVILYTLPDMNFVLK